LKKPKLSPSNKIDDNTATLQTFTLGDLAQYTKERAYSPQVSSDFHLFYVGRDDVHDILKHVMSRVTTSLYLNMFGYDDDELNDIVFALAVDPSITVLITLDQSQAGGVHEKQLIALDQEKDLASFNTHYVVGQSATHQISHTKGFVADGKVGGEGSTNWSASGEGTFVVQGQPGGAGYKAQNNTQTIFTDLDSVARFQAQLIAEHVAAQAAHSSSGSRAKAPAEGKSKAKGGRTHATDDAD
jgi:hypothetical protein